LGVAFEAVCAALRVGDRDDDVKQSITNKLIELVRDGERNPDLLCERALNLIRHGVEILMFRQRVTHADRRMIELQRAMIASQQQLRGRLADSIAVIDRSRAILLQLNGTHLPATRAAKDQS
jgi:hypothetical protein